MNARRTAVSPLFALLGSALVAIVLGACGGGSSVETVVTPITEAPPSTAATTTVAGGAATTAPVNTLGPGEKRLTTTQASTFSKVLVHNNTDGGSHFVAVIPYGPAATFTLTGDIDWKTYTGSALLTTRRSDGKVQPEQQMFWAKGQIVQPMNGLEAAMEAAGRKGIEFVSRPLDPTTVPIDRVIVLLNSMSNTRAENPILLRQRTDVAYGGTAEYKGVTYGLYRYGSTTYWLDDAGALGRLESTFSGFAGPVQIEFTDKKPRTIVLPQPATVVAAADYPAVMEFLRAHPDLADDASDSGARAEATAAVGPTVAP